MTENSSSGKPYSSGFPEIFLRVVTEKKEDAGFGGGGQMVTERTEPGVNVIIPI
jgi:hypothetical protein